MSTRNAGDGGGGSSAHVEEEAGQEEGLPAAPVAVDSDSSSFMG